PTGAPARTTSPVAPVRAPDARPARSRRRWVVGVGGIALTIALAAAAWFGSQAFNGAPPSDLATTPASMSATSSDAMSAASPDPNRAPTATDSVAARTATDSARVAIGSDKPKSGPKPEVANQRTSSTRPDQKSTGTQKDARPPTTTVAARDGAKSTGTAIEKLAEPRATGDTGTKSATPESVAVKGSGEEAARSAAVAKPADGMLSVFFLGGVGDFFVDGKRFGQQPPFEKVTMPAGSYRMGCRMSGDVAPKEIVVVIKSNQETVIEYEMGRDPVVTTE
ncbi:MAG: hypothetical protein L0Z51_02125, partial [Candidatus Latescibacteria bacterium]|nr:hypothetical protein [Candidatus Latescibacterota bacterium]